jgi:hypothetical protein
MSTTRGLVPFARLVEPLQFGVDPDQQPVHREGIQELPGDRHPLHDPGGPPVPGRAQLGYHIGAAHRTTFTGPGIPRRHQVGDLQYGHGRTLTSPPLHRAASPTPHGDTTRKSSGKYV